MIVVANEAEVTPSAPEAVRAEAEADVTAQDLVHAEPEPCTAQCRQLASSSEVIVDSDSVYSVCCSDVTTDTPDIVHVDHETPPVPGRGTADYPCFRYIHMSIYTSPYMFTRPTI